MKRKNIKYGTKIVDEKITVDRKEEKILHIIKELFLSGMSRHDIVEYLDMEGITKRYGSKWRPEDITIIVKDSEYVDLGIFTQNEHDLMLRILKRRQRGPNSKYPLAGLLFCKKCGSPMIGWGRKTKKGVLRPLYVCDNYRKNGRKACSQKNLLQVELEQEIYNQLRETVLEWMEQEKKNNPDLNCTAEVVARAKEKFDYADEELQKLNDLSLRIYWDKDSLTENQFNYMIKQLTKEIREKEEERESLYLQYRLVEEKYRQNDIQRYIDELLNLDLSNTEKAVAVFNIFIDSVWVNDSDVTIKYRFEI